MLHIADKFDKFFLKTHLRLKIHNEVIDALNVILAKGRDRS